MLTKLDFSLPDGSVSSVSVRRVLNAGYAGCDQDAVREHIDELAKLGVPAPSTTPTLYPVSPYLAQQADEVWVQHGETSGEAEWALIISDDGRELLTVACDHTDRKLETHGVAWSKNASPDVVGRDAFPLDAVRDRYDSLTLRAWVGEDQELIQDGVVADLLTPDYWLDVLEQRGERTPGTVLLSGTIPMIKGVDQFASRWKVELCDPEFGALTVDYSVKQMADPIG